MADSEACAEILKQLDIGKLSRVDDGESILLLQNLLQNPIYQNLSAQQLLNLTIGNQLKSSQNSTKMDTNNEVNDENCLGNGTSPAAFDSGRDTPKQVQSPLKNSSVGDVGAELLEEVTTALTRLQHSLSHGELALDDSKKIALLSLVDRLHQGLISPKVENSIPNDATINGNGTQNEANLERRGSSSSLNRFAKRRNRNNRHTVGVTSEELADARRIIEELEFIGLQNAAVASTFTKPKVKATHVNSNSAGVYNAILTRQISEPVTLLRPSQFLSQESLHHQDVNKPFKVVLKQSISLDNPQQPSPASILKNNKQEMADDKTKKENNLQRSSSKSFTRTKADVATTDDESSTSDEENEIKTKLTFKSFRARENYLRNQRSLDNSFNNYSSGDEASASGPRPSKYVSKKMKMKRANTVDLPKSFSFVNTFDLSDRENSDCEMMKNRNSAVNPGLSTTITGGVQPARPPSFEPKTDNDKKFLAFINKQNKDNVMPTYTNPNQNERAQKTVNWTNKFGNLKNRFENDDTPLPPKPVQKNAAATFWKSIEKTKPSAKVSPMMSSSQTPTIGLKNFPIVSEKFPWKTEKIVEKLPQPPINGDEKIVTKKLQMLEKLSSKSSEVESAPKINLEINKLSQPVLKPSNINNFTHAPMSAFKPPISRKLSNSFKPIITNEEVVKKPLPPVSNGIVKQMAENGFSQTNQTVPLQPRKMANSPTRNIASADSAFVKVKPPMEKGEAQPVPWAGKTKTDRVLSLASAKFEQGVPTVHLGKTLEIEPVTVKFRQNPLYNGTFEKRASLPPNAAFASYEHLTSNGVLTKPKETFVITDFTPSSVSTFAVQKPPTLERQDSLTNPEKEPLVLTCDRSVFSPKEIPTPSSSLISNENSSLGDFASEIENDVKSSNGSIEYKAAVAKVMKGPVAQTAAVESSLLTSINDQNKENLMMKSIQDTLKKFSQKSPTPEKKRLSQDSSSSSLDLKPSSPRIQESRLSNDSSHSSIDLKLQSVKIPIPAVPETAYSFTYNPSPPKINIKSPSIDPPAHVLYNNTSNLHRTRSTHLLNVPTARSDFSSSPSVSPIGLPSLGRVQSFFGVPSSTSPQPVSRTLVKSKMSALRQASGSSLARSKTMPSIPKKVELLDESNVEDAFEELLSSANL